MKNPKLLPAEIKELKTQARTLWASGNFSKALSKLSICDDRELYSYARKKAKTNTKHRLPEKSNWLETEGSERAWNEFLAYKDRIVSLITNPHLFDARMELMRLLGPSRACSLLQSIIHEQSEAVVLLVRESELYLSDDWAESLQSLSLPKEYTKHREVWSRLKSHVDRDQAAITKLKEDLSKLNFTEVAVASQNWIARNVENPFREDFEIESAYRIQHELLREVEMPLEVSSVELQKEIELLLIANYSSRAVDQLMYLSYQYSDFKTGVLELYNFGDIAISEHSVLAIIESSDNYHKWLAYGFRYSHIQRRFKPGEIKKPSDVLTHEATEFDLFLKEEGVPEEIVFGNVKLNRLAVVSFLTTIKLKLRVFPGAGNGVYNRAISFESIPNLFQRFYSYDAKEEDQSKVFDRRQAETLLDILSSNVNNQKPTVLLPFFKVSADLYLFTPGLISEIDWALLLRDTFPGQAGMLNRSMATGLEDRIKALFSKHKCRVLDTKEFLKEDSPGDIDVLVDFGKNVLAIQVKRPKFRLSLKEQQMEYYHSDIKAAEQASLAIPSLERSSEFHGKNIVPLVISASCEGLGEIPNNGVNKISFYDLNLVLEDEKNREWNQIQYGLEMLNETYASRAKLESPREGVRIIPIPKPG